MVDSFECVKMHGRTNPKLVCCVQVNYLCRYET